MLLAVMLYGNGSPRLVHATVAALAVVDPPHWLGMLYVMGRGSILEGTSAVMRGEWTPEMRTLFLLPVVTCAMKVSYLLGLWGPDRVTKEMKRKGL